MKRHWIQTLGLVVAAALPAVSGCVFANPIFRGQNVAPAIAVSEDGGQAEGVLPAGVVSLKSSNPGVRQVQYVEHGSVGYGETCPDGTCPEHGGFIGHGIGGHGLPGSGIASGLASHFAGGSGDWYPTHHHSYRYIGPKSGDCRNPQPVYPNATLPAGFVQYPYYTLKGPDDFFLP